MKAAAAAPHSSNNSGVSGVKCCQIPWKKIDTCHSRCANPTYCSAWYCRIAQHHRRSRDHVVGQKVQAADGMVINGASLQPIMIADRDLGLILLRQWKLIPLRELLGVKLAPAKTYLK